MSRTFSFGIKPTPEMQVRLEEWFRQIGAVKAQLYSAIFEDFRATPDKYLGQKFNYAPVDLQDNVARVAIISQIRLIDAKRLLEKVGSIDESNYAEIQKAVINLCSL